MIAVKYAICKDNSVRQAKRCKIVFSSWDNYIIQCICMDSELIRGLAVLLPFPFVFEDIILHLPTSKSASCMKKTQTLHMSSATLPNWLCGLTVLMVALQQPSKVFKLWKVHNQSVVHANTLQPLPKWRPNWAEMFRCFEPTGILKSVTVFLRNCKNQINLTAHTTPKLLHWIFRMSSTNDQARFLNYQKVSLQCINKFTMNSTGKKQKF